MKNKWITVVWYQRGEEWIVIMREHGTYGSAADYLQDARLAGIPFWRYDLCRPRSVTV